MAAGVWGPESDANALLGAFYVLLWVGLVAVSLAIGPVWRVISPIRTLYLLARRVVPERLARPRLSYPKRWGTGPPRWACSRSCGWSWPARTRRPRPG